MLQPFGVDIWLGQGPVVTAVAGFHYPTRMVVIRLSGGDLWVCSPVPLTSDLRAAMDALGTVRFLVAPNAFHHLSLLEWAQAYPQARVFGAPGLAKKRRDIRFDETLGTTPPSCWSGQMDQLIFPNRLAAEVVFFHRPSGTVIFTDLLQQMPPGWYSGWRAIIARLDLMTAPEPAVPRKFRLATPQEPGEVALKTLRAWPATQVVMAHGIPVTSDAPAFLERAFGWLSR